MIIFFWITSTIIFTAIAFLIIGILAKHPDTKTTLKIISDGIREGLRGSGFHVKKNQYQIELWKWETVNDDHVCEDCLDRASWPPMDIADWMAEGLPRTPEADTECCDQCRCQLVLYSLKSRSKKQRRKYN